MDAYTDDLLSLPTAKRMLIGKTIANVEFQYHGDDDWYDMRLVFTDGTEAVLEGTGYEADGIRIRPKENPTQGAGLKDNRR